ncbi:response regulator [Telmatospirillum sp. J64-1]|uniref:response regulator n=1 Tax=Telmatospirillum sp. J64-1 TaxID=2502183 RepID=UPI00163D40B4|nr:response regulator [Telmatospirillum sp. J64-1]
MSATPGPGIPPDERRRIFEEFYQSGNSQRDRRMGLGLGLAIVARTAALLGLPIELDSVHGRGSRFSVLVPLAETHVQPPAPRPVACHPPAVAPQTLPPGPILVVEDHPDQATALALLLEQWGRTVEVAPDGPQALARVTRMPRPPVALVTDLRLPGGLDGVDVVAEMRRRFGANLPAVIVSGDTEPKRLRRVLNHGLPLIHKPCRPETLRRALGIVPLTKVVLPQDL